MRCAWHQSSSVDRVAVVVLHHVAPVGLHGVGAGALVQHRRRPRRRTPPLAMRCEEVALVEVVGDLAVGEVGELLGAREVVHGDDVVAPRAFSALTRLEPMNPAAPVTMRVIALVFRSRMRLQARSELVAVDHRGAELADHDAGGVVGDAHRRRAGPRRGDHHAPASRSRCRPRRSRRTPRAPASARASAPSRGEERHALLAARHEQRLERRARARSVCARAREVRLVAPAARHLAELGAVGREQRGAAVARVVVALGSTSTGLPARARELDHLARCA